MTQGVKTPIDPGIVARVSAGIRYAITGKAPEWFGPGEPMAPVVPASDKPSVEGRQWDFRRSSIRRQRSGRARRLRSRSCAH